MTLKPNEAKAVGWYCESLNLRPEMSVIPTTMRFTDKATGKVKTVHLRTIITRYEAQKEKTGKLSA